MYRILAEKLLAAALTGLLISNLHWGKVVLLYIVLGQGHFFTAYLYQYKAGKINKSYLAIFVGSALAILLLYHKWPNYGLLVTITTIYFLIHMLLDEVYLMRLPMDLRRSPMNIGRFLEMSPIFLLYSARVAEALFPSLTRRHTSLGEGCLSLSWVLLGIYGLLLLSKQHRLDWKSCYFLAWSGFLITAVYSKWFYQVPTGKLTGFIIIYHYLCWYIHYYLNLQKRSQKTTYMLRISVINAVVISLYLIWGQKGPGAILFQNDNFYIWTLLHLITSTRIGDIKGLFRVKNRNPD